MDVGGGTAIAETPEMERVKRNQQAISTVHCGVTLPRPLPTHHHIPLLPIIAKTEQGYYLSDDFKLHSLHLKFILINTSF